MCSHDRGSRSGSSVLMPAPSSTASASSPNSSSNPVSPPTFTRDPNDNYLIALAREHHADVIVSGDKDLLTWNKQTAGGRHAGVVRADARRHATGLTRGVATRKNRKRCRLPLHPIYTQPGTTRRHRQHQTDVEATTCTMSISPRSARKGCSDARHAEVLGAASPSAPESGAVRTNRYRQATGAR